MPNKKSNGITIIAAIITVLGTLAAVVLDHYLSGKSVSVGSTIKQENRILYNSSHIEGTDTLLSNNDILYVGKEKTKANQKSQAKNFIIKAGTLVWDNSTYSTIQVNGLEWMTRNHDYNLDGSICYDNYEANCINYGRLYDWNSANKVCSQMGWRLPSFQEWSSWLDMFGGATSAYKYMTDDQEDNFNIELGGVKSSEFQYLNVSGVYWSQSEYVEDKQQAWFFIFYSKNRKMGRNYDSKDWFLSCRCVRDV